MSVDFNITFAFSSFAFYTHFRITFALYNFPSSWNGHLNDSTHSRTPARIEGSVT